MRKITRAFRCGRNVGGSRDPLADAATFVVDKEESPILAERSPQRSAELIANVLRRTGVFRREIIRAIENRVAQELEHRTMKLIGARLKHHVHLPADVPPEGRVVCVGQNFVFAHRLHRRRDREPVQFRIAIINAVEQKVVGVLTRAVDVEREVSPIRSGRTLRRGRGTGRQQRQFEEVSPIQRQIADFTILNHRAERRRFGLREPGFRGDLDLLGGLLRQQRNIDVDLLIHQQRNISRGPAVSGQARFHTISAGRQQGNRELAVGAGLRGTLPVSLLLHQIHGGIRQRLIRTVHNPAHDGAAQRLRSCRYNHQNNSTEQDGENGANLIHATSVALRRGLRA